MNAYVYVEGGATGRDSKEQDVRCREGFHKLLGNAGFTGRKPRLVPCGGRQAVYDHFITAHVQMPGAYVAMWIDSEEPMANTEAAWAHLQNVTTVPQWSTPGGASDDQVLLMTTCMETWIMADRATLKAHYRKDRLHDSALPSLVDLENRPRDEVQTKLAHATRDCSNAYQKGKRSFEVLRKLTPAALEKHLPSFVRVRRILNEKL